MMPAPPVSQQIQIFKIRTITGASRPALIRRSAWVCVPVVQCRIYLRYRHLDSFQGAVHALYLRHSPSANTGAPYPLASGKRQRNLLPSRVYSLECRPCDLRRSLHRSNAVAVHGPKLACTGNHLDSNFYCHGVCRPGRHPMRSTGTKKPPVTPCRGALGRQALDCPDNALAYACTARSVREKSLSAAMPLASARWHQACRWPVSCSRVSVVFNHSWRNSSRMTTI